ncbi:MAG: diaminopimelate decarboxylase [Roseiflexus sp.]
MVNLSSQNPNTPFNADLWPLTTSIDDRGRLIIGGCNVAMLAQQYGTPLYLFDEVTIRAMCRAYRTAFTAHYCGTTTVHYAGKALLNITIAQIIADEGLGLDVVSGGELHVALRSGFPPQRIHMHGNAKTRAELEQALAAGIGQIIVDNLDELDMLMHLTEYRSPPQPIALRIAPNIAADTHAHIQTGHATSKFGLPLDALDAAAEKLRTASGVHLIGLHAHLGSQLFDVAPYAAAIEVLLDSAVRLRNHYGVLIEEINVGGGIGVPYTTDQRLPDIDAWAILSGNTLGRGCERRRLPLIRLVIEPGRSVIARAGVALYTIVATKSLPHIRFLHIDGGMGDNIRPALYGARYTAALAERMGDPVEECVTITGRYCESGDVLIHDLMLPRARVGEVLAVPVAGAYTLSMASTYNLAPRPAVVLVREGEARLIQRRETYDDLIARDVR